jgi:hypothetical protein
MNKSKLEIMQEDTIRNYTAECNRILAAMKIRWAYYTDLTAMSDFRPYKNVELWFLRLSKKLGIPVRRGDSLLEVAERLRTHNQKAKDNE